MKINKLTGFLRPKKMKAAISTMIAGLILSTPGTGIAADIIFGDKELGIDWNSAGVDKKGTTSQIATFIDSHSSACGDIVFELQINASGDIKATDHDLRIMGGSNHNYIDSAGNEWVTLSLNV